MPVSLSGGLREVGQARAEKPHGLDHPVLGLDDLHRHVGDLERDPRCGNVLQVFQDETVQGLGPSRAARARACGSARATRSSPPPGPAVLVPGIESDFTGAVGVNSPMISSMIPRVSPALQLPVLVHHEREALMVS